MKTTAGRGVLLLMAAVLLAAFCVQSAAAGRTVRVGVYQNEPKVFVDEDGQAAGLFIELLEKIAAEEGWTLEYVPCEWEACLQALEAGQIDLMPDVAWSEERDQRFDFHQTPVLESWSRLYAAPGSGIAGLRDLDGKRVAVLSGSIQQSVFEQLMEGFGYQVTLVPAASLEEAFELAASGQADAAIANHLFGDYFHARYGLLRTTIDFNPTQLFYAVAEGRNADLLEGIDRRLNAWIPSPGSPYYTTLGHWTSLGLRERVPPYLLWAIGVIAVLLAAAVIGLILLGRRTVSGSRRLFQARQALRQSERHYETLARISPVGIFRTDAAGATTYVNPAWCAISGLPSEKALGDGWMEAVHPEDRPRLRQEWQDSTQRGAPSFSDYRFLRPDGSLAWVMGQAVPEVDAEGRLLGYVGTITDITERKQAEESIRRYAAELEALNALGQSVNRSVALEEVVANAIETLLKVTQTEVAFLFLREGERLILAGSGPPEAARRFGEIPEHKVGECMCGLAARDGRPMYTRDIFSDPRCTWEECKKAHYRSFAALPLTVGGEVIGVAGLACSQERDFEPQAAFLETLAAQAASGIRNAQLYAEIQRYAAELEERVAERTRDLNLALEKAQAADRIKSAFLATMSHELRTPLNSIIGFTGVLLQGLAGPLNAEQSKQLHMVSDSAQHLLALINDVLDISKIEAGQLEVRRERFDLRTAIENVLRMVTPLAQKKGLALSAVIPSGVGPLVSDQRRVEQILINLLNNAVKFTERGEVRLECETRPGWVELRVRDTGIGIHPQDMDKLFRPFQQLETGLARHHEGTGLGLAICQHLASLLGGGIRAESEPGKGSVFTVTLPLEREG